MSVPATDLQERRLTPYERLPIEKECTDTAIGAQRTSLTDPPYAKITFTCSAQALFVSRCVHASTRRRSPTTAGRYSFIQNTCLPTTGVARRTSARVTLLGPPLISTRRVLSTHICHLTMKPELKS